MTILSYKLLTPTARAPFKKHSQDAGFDLFSNEGPLGQEDGGYLLVSGQGHLFSTGVCLQTPPGYVGIIKDWSSVASNYNIYTHAGVIDTATYTGEIKILLQNHSSHARFIPRGERIAQILIFPLPEFTLLNVTELQVTERGAGGFGSTGK